MHHIDTDHAGTPKAMYHHETGEEVWSTDHETYGKTRDANAKYSHPVTGQPFEPGLRQQGQHEGQETGLYQNCYRFYDPEVGRYISQDPIGLKGGSNLYRYCPNPIEWIDPLGLFVAYRNLRADEDPAQGLSARRPDRNMSVDGHVRTGSRHNGSQFISTTTDPGVAARWAEEGQTTVKFDTDDLQPDILGNQDVIDISTLDKAKANGIRGMPLKFAADSKEVLLVGHVPQNAI